MSDAARFGAYLADLEERIARLEARLGDAAAPAPPLDTRAVAARAGASTDTVLGWVRKGLLRGHKARGTRDWRFRPEDVETFLHAGREPVSSAPVVTDIRQARATRVRRLLDGALGARGQRE